MDFVNEVLRYVTSQCDDKVTLNQNEIQIPSRSISFFLNPITNTIFNKPDRMNIIWEDEWIHKGKIIQSRIQSKLGKTERFYGRETIIEKLTQPVANEFLNENHLLGTTPARTKLGLLHENQLVAIATFSGPTKIPRNEEVYKSYEMIRYCTLAGTTVTGGLSKLLNHFIKTISPDDIMTYVDRDWSNGESFLKLGFKVVETTPPNEFWIDQQDMTRHIVRLNHTIPEGALRIVNSGNLKLIRFLK